MDFPYKPELNSGQILTGSGVDLDDIAFVYEQRYINLCAGLNGGRGFAPCSNIGDSTRIYEAVHGSAPDIAGQDKANPSAILMAFAMMLNDLGETDKAAKLNAAILAQVEEGKVVTADIGGTAGTKEFTQANIARL